MVSATRGMAHLGPLVTGGLLSCVYTVTRVDRSFAVALQQARMQKGMTQKDLATRISEKPSVINDYESGRAIPNPNIINKLDRALGTHLPRGFKKK